MEGGCKGREKGKEGRGKGPTDSGRNRQTEEGKGVGLRDQQTERGKDRQGKGRGMGKGPTDRGRNRQTEEGKGEGEGTHRQREELTGREKEGGRQKDNNSLCANGGSSRHREAPKQKWVREVNPASTSRNDDRV
jgi:hypothetical protein